MKAHVMGTVFIALMVLFASGGLCAQTVPGAGDVPPTQPAPLPVASIQPQGPGDDGLCAPLPPPQAGAPVVTVSTEAALREQAASAAPGTTIFVAAGTYDLQGAVQVLGDGVTIRGATGNRDDVILDGGGMLTFSNTHVIYIDADDVTVADLTIRNADEHGISVNGSDRPFLYNLHIVDTGYQLVKVNPLGDGSEGGVLACSHLEYTTTAPTDYTNGISAHDAHDWTVRDNLWERIRTPENVPAPTILFWSGSTGTLVERNVLIDCFQGIAFGNSGHEGPDDHVGGVVRNNFIYASLPHDSVVEMVHARDWLVAHNTALLLDPYGGVTWGMEARFEDSSGTFAYNLLNMPIWNDRDDAAGAVTGNVTTADGSWFADPGVGDLHLLASAAGAIDQAGALAQVSDDVDGDLRPIGSAPDIGADEFGTPAPPPELTPTAYLPIVTAVAPVAGARIQPEDLFYLGAFRLPDVAGADEFSWAWGGSSMAYYPDGDPGGPDDGFPGSLFGTGHEWNQYVGEVSIPVPVISPGRDVSDLNTAVMLQDFADIRGDLFDFASFEIPRVGLAYLPPRGAQTTGKLYFAWGQHLQETETGPTHGWAELTLADPRPVGAWRVGGYRNYVTNDYLFSIPQAWADVYVPGMELATGRYRDGGQGAQGPSILAIGPWNAGNPPAAGATILATPLLLYPDVATDETVTMDGYHHSDEWSGAVWLTAGERAAVVFVGTKGQGDCWYGCADGTVWEPPYPDECPDGSGRGWWSTGFVGQMVFYDPADLAAVATGAMSPYEPQPYATLDVDHLLYNVTSTQQKYHLGAASFDPERGLLYVFEVLADEDKPLVHVWRVE
ncbi:MAG: right-handed parallel beta-helix repeat-containing protein [Anaerolineae bacterium]|nr:right-handed parallel beta-helix repeat-containing protein [Anaerolineae bacterium]